MRPLATQSKKRAVIAGSVHGSLRRCDIGRRRRVDAEHRNRVSHDSRAEVLAAGRGGVAEQDHPTELAHQAGGRRKHVRMSGDVEGDVDHRATGDLANHIERGANVGSDHVGGAALASQGSARLGQVRSR